MKASAGADVVSLRWVRLAASVLFLRRDIGYRNGALCLVERVTILL